MSESSGEGAELYHGYSVDDEDQPQGSDDSLADGRGLVEPLDEGYSPADRWSAGQGFGNTPYEEQLGESLAQRLAQEEAELDPYSSPLQEGGQQIGGVRAGDLVAYDPGAGDTVDERPRARGRGDAEHTFTADEAPYWGRQVGGRRSGRLVSYDAGSGEDEDADSVAFDVGIDGAGASAEEAAMHVVDDDDG